MNQRQIILFDGVCNLCNSSVNFVIDRDKQNAFVFAALQSKEGQDILKNFEMSDEYIDSIVLVKNGRLYKKSAAALHVSLKLSGLWPLMGVFSIIPPFIRDLVYDFIARNRYKWFGRRDECRIPTPDLQAKFLSGEAA